MPNYVLSRRRDRCACTGIVSEKNFLGVVERGVTRLLVTVQQVMQHGLQDPLHVLPRSAPWSAPRPPGSAPCTSKIRSMFVSWTSSISWAWLRNCSTSRWARISAAKSFIGSFCSPTSTFNRTTIHCQVNDRDRCFTNRFNQSNQIILLTDDIQITWQNDNAWAGKTTPQVSYNCTVFRKKTPTHIFSHISMNYLWI